MTAADAADAAAPAPAPAPVQRARPGQVRTLSELRALVVETVGAADNSDGFHCGRDAMRLLDTDWFNECLAAVSMIRNRDMDALRLNYGQVPEGDPVVERITRQADAAHKLVWNVFLSVSAARRVMHLRTPDADPTDEGEWPMSDPMGRTLALRTAQDDAQDPKSKYNDILTLLEYMNYVFSALELRHKDDVLYRNVKVNGVETIAWEPLPREGGDDDENHTIKTFTQYACSKTVRPDMWMMLHRGVHDTTARLESYFLDGCGDVYLPRVRHNKRIFSFPCGVWDLRCVAAARADGYTGEVPCGTYTPYPLPAGHPLLNEVAARHFDMPFPHEDLTKPRAELRDTSMREIFAAQQLDTVREGDRFSEYELFLAFYARMFFDLNELEEWQAALMLEGRAQTGKSTCAHFVAGTYDQADVAVLSNNMEEKFGMQAIVRGGKKIWVGFEIKSDFCCNQAEFQSLISGDSMSVAVKNKNTFQAKRVRITGMMFGNSRPRFDGDPHGAVARRLPSVLMAHCISRADSTLQDRLHEDRPLIMITAVKVLIDMLRIAGKRDVWAVVPQAVALRRCETTNPLVAFLHSGRLRLIDEEEREELGCDSQSMSQYSMSMTDFKQTYNAWCKLQLLNPGQVNINDRSQYRSVFADFKLSIIDAVGSDIVVVGCAPREASNDECGGQYGNGGHDGGKAGPSGHGGQSDRPSKRPRFLG